MADQQGQQGSTDGRRSRINWQFTVVVGAANFEGDCEAASPSEALDKAAAFVVKAYGIDRQTITKIDARPKGQ